MYLTEDYNSPQSVYWALKSFVAIMLPSNEPFWTEAEQAYPTMGPSEAVVALHAPRQIICSAAERHHFLLSSAQFTSLYWKGAAAKYSKFAYSSAFGFSVPTGQATLQQLAPDNTLALSRDGRQTWAVKWKCREPTFGVAKVYSGADRVLEELSTMHVVWYPWDDRTVSVTTTLVPPSRKWPDWHLRVHRIRVEQDGIRALHIAEGGFAMSGGRKTSNQWLEKININGENDDNYERYLEGFASDADSAVIFSRSGASGVSSFLIESSGAFEIKRAMSVLQPEANTNIVSPRSLIPLAEHEATRLNKGDEVVLCTSIFASLDDGDQSPNCNEHHRNAWRDRPRVETSMKETGDFIHLFT
jgi:hypothetical protein